MTARDEPADNAADRQPPSNRGGAVSRLRLTRRVVDALMPLDRAVLETDGESMPAPSSSANILRTDLLVKALDLRVRLSLMPGATADRLDAPEVLSAARALLMENADTASVAIVVDDALLTCQIVEPFDSPNVLAPSGQRTAPRIDASRGPVGDVLRFYLRQINPGWEAPPRMQESQLDLDRSALTAATAALDDLRTKRKITPEWKTARATLNADDARWIAERAVRVLEGKQFDVTTDIANRAARVER